LRQVKRDLLCSVLFLEVFCSKQTLLLCHCITLIILFLYRPLRQTTSWESQTSMDSSAGSSNRTVSCDEPSIQHQTVLESGEESSDQSNSDEADNTFQEATAVSNKRPAGH